MRRLLPILAFLVSCANNNSGAEKVATEVFAAFNAHDWPKMESLYASDVELVDPSFGTKIGKEGMTDFYGSVADIHDEVKTITTSGNTVVVEFVSTGTIGGQKFSLPICTVFKIENGLVISDHTYYDNN